MNNNQKELTYLVAGSKPWSRVVFQSTLTHYPGQWYFVGSKQEFTEQAINEIAPRYVFFLHWSWMVPDSIIDTYECVCFHMTDVPYGRGGSPLQNLIQRGHANTKLTAFRMTHELDAGPVYMKEDLSLEGSAEEIYIRATLLSAKMIERIILEKPSPVPQSGDPVIFKRRRPEESEIPTHTDLKELYDFIRMLDAESYPPAFLEHKGFRFEFSRAQLLQGRITGEITITPREEKKK